MDNTLAYAGTKTGQRHSKLAIAALCVGAMLIPTVAIISCDIVQGSVDFGDSVTHSQANAWGFLGAIPGILGALLAFIALIRVVRNSSKPSGIAMALVGLLFATWAACLGAFYMMVISLQNS